MRKSKKSERKTIILLVAVLLFMAVGFAAYSQVLNIGGGTNDKATKATFKNAWNIHYVTTSYKETGTTATVNAHELTGTDFTFDVTLNKPGDTYVADWDIKNDGTLNAVLKQINLSNLSEAQQKYVEYKINYAGTDYTASTDSLNIALNSGDTAHVKLTITYKTTATEKELPTSDDAITISGSFKYDEKTGS